MIDDFDYIFRVVSLKYKSNTWTINLEDLKEQKFIYEVKGKKNENFYFGKNDVLKARSIDSITTT